MLLVFFFFAFADVLLNNKTALFIMLFKLVSLDKGLIGDQIGYQ